MTEFMTSDQHFWHVNIIDFCYRPYVSVDKMNKDFIKRHNEVVKPNDVVWHVGDFVMAGPDRKHLVGAILSKLNGKHHLVLGNHDGVKPFDYVEIGFTSVHTSYMMEREGLNIYLVHDPSSYEVIQHDPKHLLLCGHIHTLFRHLLPAKKVINVGVDVWDYKPVSLEDLLSFYNKNKNSG